MILVSCEHCGYKISVQDSLAGKRGKCPRCGTFFVVPEKSTSIDFQCGSCGLKISVPRINAGKKGSCPRCKNTIAIPEIEKPESKLKQEKIDYSIPRLAGNDAGLTLLEVPEEYKLKEESDDGFDRITKTAEQEAAPEEKSAKDKVEVVTQRSLPWIIDIFLYPISKAGLTTLSIIILLPLLISIFTKWLGKFSREFVPLMVFFVPIAFAGFILKIVLFLYLYWYFCECIRDSAAGGIRAPETVAITPGLGEIIWQFVRVAVCLLVFIAPPVLYYLNTGETNTIFGVLVVYAILFLPMALLAVVMFDSFSGLNPVLLVGSILSTFLPYCAMIAAFITLSFLIPHYLPETVGSPVLAFLFYCVGIYLLIVTAHLLGWFYCRYQNELNWEV